MTDMDENASPGPDDLPPKDPADMSADELRAMVAGQQEVLVQMLNAQRAWSLRATKGHGCMGRYCQCLDGELADHVRELEGYPGWPLPNRN